MSKPLFRIEELIEALLKGSPNDPVYLRVGSSTYGIEAIDNGSIRVKSGKDTQDSAQVVKTLRRYASGTPKGEDTGIAWRIVGVGGGTAIRSVSYSNGKIVVRTLANEGKKMDAEDSPDYDASAYDPLSESATPSGYDPVTFEAPKAKAKKPKQEKTYRQTHDAAVSNKIRSLMHEFDRTGMVGRSKPANRKAALNQAVAVAYSMTAATYRKSGKRLPKGVKRAEGEQSHPFDAPMGYGPEGSRPFYGNARRLARDRWGNLRFIRRRKDGTYMDNVDFGRSLKMDRRRQAKTWAPPGFRDQGDGSFDLLTSLMGAEGDDEYRYQFVVEVYDTNGEECYGVGGYFSGAGSTIQQAADSARASIFKDMEKEDRRIKKAQSRNKAPRAQATRSVAGARFVTVMEFDDDELDYVEIDADLPADIKLNTAMAAESSPDYNASAYDPLSESATPSGYDPVTFGAESSNMDSVWLVNSALDGNWEEALLFWDESDARASFEEYIDQLGGKVADASYGDWSGDDGFRRVVMYQVTIQ
ncbi:hypothetical protein N9L01_00355 [bacterium]|nr:hypothetical protein [bacterium]